MLHDKVLSMVRYTTEKRTSTRLHGLKMNQRIKELWNQANIRHVNDYALSGELREQRRSVPDIFAELIVRECSQMVHDSHPDDLPFVGGKMLVHFGVE